MQLCSARSVGNSIAIIAVGTNSTGVQRTTECHKLSKLVAQHTRKLSLRVRFKLAHIS